VASYRHLARIAVMQALFAYEFRGGDADEILKYNAHEFADKLKELDFAESLLHGVLEKKDEIVLIVEEEAPEWPFDKISPVDRAVLQIGIYEVLYSQDVPAIVAINEAVEIAKSYGDVNSPKFVNGVLSTVMRKYGTAAQNGEIKDKNS
jgi:N utilization substance protein B